MGNTARILGKQNLLRNHLFRCLQIENLLECGGTIGWCIDIQVVEQADEKLSAPGGMVVV
jgi:hypothetical protein